MQLEEEQLSKKIVKICKKNERSRKFMEEESDEEEVIEKVELVKKKKVIKCKSLSMKIKQVEVIAPVKNKKRASVTLTKN